MVQVGERLQLHLDGNLSLGEVLWGIEQIKLKMLTGQQPERYPSIPGMLTPDGKRVKIS